MSVATAGSRQPVREHFRTLRTIENDSAFQHGRTGDTRGGCPSAYPSLVATARDSRQRQRLRRDRHGRGLRGVLYPATLPAAASRAEKFDALVLDALEPIEARWRHELTKLDVAVDDVPEIERPGTEPTPESIEGVLHDGSVPLSRLVPAGVDRAGLPTRARIVLYRRPLEARAKDPVELAELVHDVLVEQVAGYLGLEPDVIEGE